MLWKEGRKELSWREGRGQGWGRGLSPAVAGPGFIRLVCLYTESSKLQPFAKPLPTREGPLMSQSIGNYCHELCQGLARGQGLAGGGGCSCH